MPNLKMVLWDVFVLVLTVPLVTLPDVLLVMLVIPSDLLPVILVMMLTVYLAQMLLVPVPLVP